MPGALQLSPPQALLVAVTQMLTHFLSTLLFRLRLLSLLWEGEEEKTSHSGVSGVLGLQAELKLAV